MVLSPEAVTMSSTQAKNGSSLTQEKVAELMHGY